MKVKREIKHRQLLHVIYNNRAMFDRKVKKLCVFVVEKVIYADGEYEKRIKKILDPTLKYYITKPEHILENPVYYIKKDLCDQYESRIEDIDLHIAELTNQKNAYYDMGGSGAKSRRKVLHLHKDLHGTDVRVVDHYISRYMDKFDHQNTYFEITKAFSDIEVDHHNYEGFPDENTAPCPINIISYFHLPTRTLHQYHNLDTNNENQRKFLYPADEESERKRCNWIMDEVNKGHEDNPRCMRVVLHRCKDEKEILVEYFKKLKQDSPDFNMFWNMKFDALTMMNRMEHLGLDPNELFCDDGLAPYNFVNYFKDEFTSDHIFKNDVLHNTSRTLWVDQMLLYAALRRHLAKKPSYALDAILNYEINEGKVKYEGSIRDFCRRDYPLFSIYAAIDVIASSTLEDKLRDIDFNHSLFHLTRTNFYDTLKKTRCLRNLASQYYEKKGFVLSNNRNAIRRPLRPNYKGGFVSDPEKMGNTGMMIGDEPSSRIFESVVDSDATSLYPSIFRAFNIDPAGQWGNLIINAGDKEMKADSIAEHLTAGNRIEAGKVLLGLPGIEDALNILNI